ncbi:MAG: hypothetical protein K2X98_02900 [Alphaproteobacteria bacterium]|nr:hypothetical protein [Alphaproteobacteria bacterium]
MRIERTPVTVYDVFGYVLPGVLIVTYILYDVGIFDDVKGKILNTPDTWADDALIAILYFTFCYVMGQVLSYLGTFFIEDIVRAFYGAPGCYLMMTKGEQEKIRWTRTTIEKLEPCKKINEAWDDQNLKCKDKFLIFVRIALSTIAVAFLWLLRLGFSFFHGLILWAFKPLIGPYIYMSDRFDGDKESFPPDPRGKLVHFLEKRELLIPPEKEEKKNNSLFLLVSSFIRYEEEAKYINNYMVLTGAMRTFSMAFLLMGWWEVGQYYGYIDGHEYVIVDQAYFLFFNSNQLVSLFGIPEVIPSIFNGPACFLSFFVISIILMLLYIKFDRRYAEEIITAVIHNNYEEKKSEEKKCPICICEKKK